MNHDSPEPGGADIPGAGRLRAAGRVPPPSAATVDAALRAVRAAAAAERTGAPGPAADGVVVLAPAGPPAARRRPARLRIAAAAVAAVAAVAVGAVMVPGGPPPAGVTTGQPADAAAFLGRMADVAAGQPALPAGTPVWKVRSVDTRGGRTVEETVWLSRAGVVARARDGEVSHPTGAVADEAFTWGLPGREVGWGDLDRLPTRPKELWMRLAGPARTPREQALLFRAVDGLLARSPAGPQLRAALFRVLADIPGVRVAGDVEDGAGRVGTAVELDYERRKAYRMVIDPGTSRVLASDHVDPTRRDDEVAARTTYLAAEPARRIPAGSEGPSRPPGGPRTGTPGTGTPGTEASRSGRSATARP
ncbi:CU044_5270 family protein [Streptomyces pactum]|uniref:CU044_5270 family protein n=1 Tax=Streptomyces pactum TaxID=68249 RepID=A0ABS0NRL3_9ACTN|nr:CU044_5270 family protein [Streptomyces pactum]MBH5337854.1 CU044_5270 family protein [Streptomyces pactum]